MTEDKGKDKHAEMAATVMAMRHIIAGAVGEAIIQHMRAIICPWGETEHLAVSAPRPSEDGTSLLVQFKFGQGMKMYPLCECYLLGQIELDSEIIFTGNADQKASEHVKEMAGTAVDGMVEYFLLHRDPAVNSAEHDMAAHMSMHESYTEIPCDRCTKLEKDVADARRINVETRKVMQ